MLNRHELLAYRLLRGVSQRETARYGGLSNGMISLMESGGKPITPYNHRAYCDGVNKAYQAKKKRAQKAAHEK